MYMELRILTEYLMAEQEQMRKSLRNILILIHEQPQHIELFHNAKSAPHFAFHLLRLFSSVYKLCSREPYSRHSRISLQAPCCF